MEWEGQAYTKDKFMGWLDYLVENDPLYVSYGVAPSVQHAAQDLRGHDKTVCLGVYTHIPRNQSYLRCRRTVCTSARLALELVAEVAVLLVAEGLDG